MDTPFESPHFLVSQTRENLIEFEKLCKSVFEGKCAYSDIEIDKINGNKRFSIKFINPIPVKARYIAASAISDLRHALDQAACASVQMITGNDPGHLYFPFAANPDDLAGRLRKNFPCEIHSAFESFKVYPPVEGGDGGDKLLSDFGKAAGPNKHRASCKVGGMIGTLFIDKMVAKGAIEINMPPLWDVENNEIIVGTTHPGGSIEYKFSIGYRVVLSDAGPLSGMSASATLGALVDQVGGIVSALENETARIVSGRIT